MHTRLFTKISLFVAILTLPQLVTSTSISRTIWCSSVLASDIKEIGEPGDHGEPGNKGRDGRNSDSLTVFADGSPMTLDLTGEKGFAGQAGNKGYDAICEEQPKETDKNLRNSDGGNGGDGGDGGAGGTGGSLTVYTTNQEYLKQIYVIATGGEGGQPGLGGEGGNGCQCKTSYWNEETCTGNPGSPDYRCTTKEFKCIDGYGGQKGRKGRKGRDGNLGNLTLINLDKSLAPDRPEATVTLSDLKDRGFTLSKNIWEIRTGAAALFAPGSIISDKYKELTARHEHSVLLVWDAPQPVTNFADEQVILSLKGENDADIIFPEDLWLETTAIKRDRVTELFVFNAIWEDEVADLKSDGIYGSGANLELDIIDRANQSDLVKTDFIVQYRVKNNDDKEFRKIYDYRTQDQGGVPTDLIIQDADVFIIRLGQLGIPPEHLQPGVEIEVQVEAKRTFGERSKVKKISAKHKIKDEE
ncbi:MAG: collagen-like protein [Pleurocapsa sp.]